MAPTQETRDALTQAVQALTGTKNQSAATKQLLRLARGALRSTLASERELAEYLAQVRAIRGAE